MISNLLKRPTKFLLVLFLVCFFIFPIIGNASQKEVWVCGSSETVEAGVFGDQVLVEKTSTGIKAQLEVSASGDIYFNNRFAEFAFKAKEVKRSGGDINFVANLVWSKSKKNGIVFDGNTYTGFNTSIAFDARPTGGVLILTQTLVPMRTVSTSFYFCDKI